MLDTQRSASGVVCAGLGRRRVQGRDGVPLVKPSYKARCSGCRAIDTRPAPGVECSRPEPRDRPRGGRRLAALSMAGLPPFSLLVRSSPTRRDPASRRCVMVASPWRELLSPSRQGSPDRAVRRPARGPAEGRPPGAGRPLDRSRRPRRDGLFKDRPRPGTALMSSSHHGARAWVAMPDRGTGSTCAERASRTIRRRVGRIRVRAAPGASLRGSMSGRSGVGARLRLGGGPTRCSPPDPPAQTERCTATSAPSSSRQSSWSASAGRRGGTWGRHS